MAQSTEPIYHSLDDIRARKEALRQELDNGSQTFKSHWNSLFHQPKSNTPSRRMTKFMPTGATFFDGILLAWKLYNRFGGGRNGKVTKKRKSLMARILQL